MAGKVALDSFGTKTSLQASGESVKYFRLAVLEEKGLAKVSSLPFTIKILLEQALRNENGEEVTKQDVEKLLGYDPKNPAKVEIPYKPARVLMQDFTGVPAVVDLAALRSAMDELGKDPKQINPQLPVDLVIDHSVQVDEYGTETALETNAKLEFHRNRERYEFLHWGQKAFDNFRVVPPASGICHQVNLEYLGQVVQHRDDGAGKFAFPDTLVGTDSHTTMINGLGILGWGVGGIEAEAAMLGQPIYMLMPEVVGFRITGKLPIGATATDLVLAVTEILRQKGVVGRFVEFFGPGLDNLTLPDRATVSNMAPEYGATCGFFPVDDEAIKYMRYSGRSEKTISLVQAYCKAQGLYRDANTPEPTFKDVVELDLSTIVPALAGPKRPQDRIPVSEAKKAWNTHLTAPVGPQGFGLDEADVNKQADVTYPDGAKGVLKNGDVVIAAITSCTNTSNPWVMIGAGVLAKNAIEKGLKVPPYVKTSLAPGSNVVTYYLENSGLVPYLNQAGFNTVGFGCTTCIGNSGPLPDHIASAIEEKDLVVGAVLSGNRNFEGRINPHTRANYLASPILVVAYAFAGTMNIDFETDPIGTGNDGQPVFLKEIWPENDAISANLKHAENADGFNEVYETILTGNKTWNAIPSTDEPVYSWTEDSTYIQKPPFFEGMTVDVKPIAPIKDAYVLVKVGNSVTTDHISPAGAIPADSPAGSFLQGKGVTKDDFNSYGSRRGNDRVMTRGTFGNIRLRNQMAPGTEGGYTTHVPSGKQTSIYEASLLYKKENTPTIVLAGKDYGMGSSRDWAAKGTFLLGVKAVIAESFERIHRSNLVGMGVLPLQFKDGQNAQSLGLTGQETFSIVIDDNLKAGQDVIITVKASEGAESKFTVLCRIDTPIEVQYYRNGGILHTVLRKLM